MLQRFARTRDPHNATLPSPLVKSWLTLCNPSPLNFAEFGAPILLNQMKNKIRPTIFMFFINLSPSATIFHPVNYAILRFFVASLLDSKLINFRVQLVFCRDTVFSHIVPDLFSKVIY